MKLLNRFQVLTTPFRQKRDNTRSLEPPLTPPTPQGAKRTSAKWLPVPLSFALALGGVSLGAIPAAQAADGGMISVTFDDGWASQHDNALPVLNKYGIPATMYVISGSVNDAPPYMTTAQVKAFANRGDQIASHTVTHPDLTTLTPAQVTTELAQSQTTLRQLFGASAAVDFATPFGASNAATTAEAKKYYATQRNTDEGFNSRTGFDPYNLLVQNVVSTTTAQQVQGWITDAKNSGTWLILVYHEIGANVGGDIYHTDTAALDSHMAAVKNSGLSLVTVRQGAAAFGSGTPTPPTPPAPPTTPDAAMTAINAVAAANPRLGAPTGNMVCGLVNGGCYRNYSAGAILWSKNTGAHYTYGAIRQTWAGTGFERGRLGYPITDEIGGLVNGGVYQMYQGGAINWSAASGAHYTIGAIRQTWAGTGFERGRLGYPTSDEVGGLINGGVYQMYQRGAINWSAASGAHYTLGAIRQTWAGTGFERGRLGYPTSNEIGGLINGGVYQMYQGGAINWSASTGAHYTLGAIRQAWALAGFERGRLGYPVSNEYAVAGGVAQDYQGGRITWTANRGAVVAYK